MSGFIYIWYDRKHKRYYIGSHWGTIDDGYICSSRWMRKAHKRRPQDFKRRILKFVSTSRKQLLEEETRYLSMIKDDEVRIRYYNLRRSAIGHWTADDNKSKTIGEKISNTMKTSEYRDKRHKHSDETKQKMSEARKGIKMSDEAKQKLSVYMKNKPAWNKGKTNQNGRKSYLITTPSGEMIKIIGLQQFCKEHSLNNGRMSDVANRKQSNHKGYFCSYINKDNKNNNKTT